MLRKIVSYSLFVSFFTCLGLFSSAGAADIDLNGKWDCAAGDEGTFYIRQIDKTIWWYGEASDVAPEWSNVAEGKVVSNGKKLKLDWADVPKGGIISNGTLQIKVDTADHLLLTSETGGFACSEWNRIVE